MGLAACREAYFLQKLHHPNIVECYDVVDDGKQMVLVMEYLRGGQLFDHLHMVTGDRYTEQQAAALFTQASGLFSAHRSWQPCSVHSSQGKPYTVSWPM